MSAALTVTGLEVRYGTLTALRDVSTSLDRGELVALIGPNGAGKTTLLRALAGLVPARGEVCLGAGTARPVRVAYVAQRLGFDPAFPITAGRLVGTGRRGFTGRWRPLRATDRAAVRGALHRVGLPDLGARPIAELSGGQLQRVVLARALAQEADVLLLDEPLSAVDHPTCDELLGLLRSLCDAGRTVLLSTHDLGLVRRRFDRCLGVNRTLRVDGPADALREDVLDALFRPPEAA